MVHIGVDGCKAGWLAIARRGDDLDYHVASNVDELALTFKSVERILIDVPIGLPWSEVPVRPNDALARELLGEPRRRSVFAVPCRSALSASSFDKAKQANLAEIRRSVGAQTWGICPKIAEVDRFMLASKTHGRFREIHPELCFWALAKRRPMANKKSSSQGIEERLRVLEQHEPEVRGLLNRVLAETSRKQVAADDVLDAAVAFVTSEAKRGTLASLIGNPPHDSSGLPMEMLYLRTWDDHVA